MVGEVARQAVEEVQVVVRLSRQHAGAVLAEEQRLEGAERLQRRRPERLQAGQHLRLGGQPAGALEHGLAALPRRRLVAEAGAPEPADALVGHLVVALGVQGEQVEERQRARRSAATNMRVEQVDGRSILAEHGEELHLLHQVDELLDGGGLDRLPPRVHGTGVGRLAGRAHRCQHGRHLEPADG
jgi:hypothetical protein